MSKTTKVKTKKTKIAKKTACKECPFCGYGTPGKDEPLTLDFWSDCVLIAGRDQLVKFFYVTCPKCKAQGPEARSEEEAVALWNEARRLNDGV